MYTSIKLDKVRNLRFGMVALNRLEKALKTSVANLDLENATMEETATIMWAGLVHEDKELTPDKVMELIDDYSNIADAIKAMGEAFAQAFGGGNGEEKNAQKAAVKTESSAS